MSPMNPRLMRPLARRQAPAPGPTDPYFSQVVLLLHMDGASNSTTFTDSSSSPKTVAANGDAKISTAQSKFGGSSALFDGDGDSLSVDTGQFSGDYTIEFWFRLATAETFWSLIGYTGGANAHIHTYTDGFLYANDAATGMISGGLIVPAQWSHLALVRHDGETTLYQDGVAVGSTSSTIGQGDGTLTIGFVNGGVYLAGYIDELRVTAGLNGARYTANFTPPTAPFPNS